MGSVSRHILDLSRRGLLRGATAMVALAATRPAFAQRTAPMPIFQSDPFPLGVASGDPQPDGVVLWTQLSQNPLGESGLPAAALELGWEVAEDETFTRIAARGTALARPELNHSLRVEVTGLRPAATYHYRFLAGGVASLAGRTRTAPSPDSMPARVRFVSAGCQHYEQGLYTAWRHIAAEPDLDFVFHYGDYIYEGGARDHTSGRVPRLHNSPAVKTLDAYRHRYGLYKLDRDLQAAHRAHPFVMSFDDHEVRNNWTGGEPDGEEPPVRAALRRAAAFQAWYESMPLRPAQTPRGPDITAWRALRWGRTVDLAVLDTRSHRDKQPCKDIAPLCEAALNPAAQVLGSTQEEWLKRWLQESPGGWKLLAQQIMMMRWDLGETAPAFGTDGWDAYPAARNRLLEHVRDAGVRNLVVLTGDVHCAWAGRLKLDYGDPRSPALGLEFVATSISSGRDGSEMRPAGPRILSRNPHIAFHNNRRGYCLHEAEPVRLTTSYRTVPYVSRPDAPVETRGRFVVQAGRSELMPA